RAAAASPARSAARPSTTSSSTRFFTPTSSHGVRQRPPGAIPELPVLTSRPRVARGSRPLGLGSLLQLAVDDHVDVLVEEAEVVRDRRDLRNRCWIDPHD